MSLGQPVRSSNPGPLAFSVSTLPTELTVPLTCNLSKCVQNQTASSSHMYFHLQIIVQLPEGTYLTQISFPTNENVGTFTVEVLQTGNNDTTVIGDDEIAEVRTERLGQREVIHFP